MLIATITSCETNNSLSFEELTGLKDYGLYDPSNWPSSCQQIKADYSHDWMYAKYSEKPKIKVNNDIWVITYSLIPKAQSINCRLKT
jgi:hypothetical protein